MQGASGEIRTQWALGLMAGGPLTCHNVRETENTPLTAWGACTAPQRLEPPPPSRTREAKRPTPTTDVKKASKNHGSEHRSQQKNVY